MRMPSSPVPKQIAADSANAMAFGDSEVTRRSTGKVMKILRSINMTLMIKITGFRFLKGRSSRLNRETASEYMRLGAFARWNPQCVRALQVH